MTCERVCDLLPDWVEGRLEADEAAAIRTHVESCAECAAEAEVVRLIATAGPVSAPEGLEARVVAATLAAARDLRVSGGSQSDVRPIRPRWAVPQWALGAAAVLVLALGTPLLMDRMADSSDADTIVDTPVEIAAVEDPIATVWASDDGLIAGAPVLETLTDEELALLLEEMGG